MSALMKKIYSFVLLSFFCCFLQAQNLKWVTNFGNYPSSSVGTSISFDLSGNLCTTGIFTGTVDFDPGPSTFNLTSIGNNNIYITKMDTVGNLIWAKALEGGGNDNTVKSIKIDPSGNIYIVGAFGNTIDFDPGPSVYNLTSQGFLNTFILKLDSAGTFLWVHSYINSWPFLSNFNFATALAFDTNENIYISGWFKDTVNFDIGITNYTLNTPGNYNLYISKLDSSGNFIWAKQIGGLYEAFSGSIEVSSSGHIYLIGTFADTVDFDTGTGTYNLTALGSPGHYDVFILKLDLYGNFIWAKRIGGNYNDEASSLKLDAAENIYFSGIISGIADLNPDPSIIDTLGEAGVVSFFIDKLDSSGTLIWKKHIRTMNSYTYQLIVKEIAIDNSGNVYAAGDFNGLVDFNPDPVSNYILDGIAGYHNGFICKLSDAGDFIWAEQLRNNIGSNFINGMVVDGTGNVYTTGAFKGGTDFDPGVDTFFLSPTVVSNSFIMKFNYCGANYEDSFIYSSCDSVIINGISYNYSGEYIQQYNPGIGCDSNIIFHIAINSTSQVIYPSSCDAYTFNGSTYTTSGLYIFNFINTAGCDSTIYCQLTINSSTIDTIVQTSCGSYVLNSQTYTMNGIYTQTLATTSGCDSVITLDLTIIPNSNFVLYDTSCNFFTFNSQTYNYSGSFIQTFVNALGCDSFITLNIVIYYSNAADIFFNGCKNYIFNGQTYTFSGTYVQPHLNSLGCDSSITLHLNISHANTSVYHSGTLLSSNAGGAIYQWAICPSYSIIAGATDQTYTATADGDYAVIVIQNGCTDTSLCYTVNTVGINHYLNNNQINIFPNPTSGIFNIISNSTLNGASMHLLAMTGEIILQQEHLSGKQFSFDISDKAKGIYYLEINENGKKERMKIVKE